MEKFYSIWLKRPCDEKPELVDDYPLTKSKIKAVSLAKQLLKEVNPESIVYVRLITTGKLECIQYEFTNDRN